MKTKNKYPEHIMKTLRQGRGLEPNDTSEDTEINTYSPNEAFDGMLHWEGIINYTDTIKYWIESIYGIDLDTIETEDDTYEEEWEDDSDRSCKDCPPSECNGHCMSCYYRSV
jgi:hypothetical protein